MKITKYGHACLLIEEAGARLLIDPGAYSQGFEELTGLSAIMYTHKHEDHFDHDKLTKLIDKNDGVRVICDSGTAAKLEEQGIRCETVDDGDALEIDGVAVKVIGSDHAPIHAELPLDANVGYLVAGRLFHAGDNYVVPSEPVELLAFALVAPWAKASETIDYVRAVAPKVAIPIHDAITSANDLYTGLVDGLTKDHIEVREIKDGETAEF